LPFGHTSAQEVLQLILDVLVLHFRLGEKVRGSLRDAFIDSLHLYPWLKLERRSDFSSLVSWAHIPSSPLGYTWSRVNH
jgi:hypothetical protein